LSSEFDFSQIESLLSSVSSREVKRLLICCKNGAGITLLKEVNMKYLIMFLMLCVPVMAQGVSGEGTYRTDNDDGGILPFSLYVNETLSIVEAAVDGLPFRATAYDILPGLAEVEYDGNLMGFWTIGEVNAVLLASIGDDNVEPHAFYLKMCWLNPNINIPMGGGSTYGISEYTVAADSYQTATRSTWKRSKQ
jgi:hypothetical protein